MRMRHGLAPLLLVASAAPAGDIVVVPDFEDLR